MPEELKTAILAVLAAETTVKEKNIASTVAHGEFHAASRRVEELEMQLNAVREKLKLPSTCFVNFSGRFFRLNHAHGNRGALMQVQEFTFADISKEV